MKMTDADESALLAIVHAIDDLHEAFAPTAELRRARDYLRARLAADQQKGGGGCHCATCSCGVWMTKAIRFDCSPAESDAEVRKKLIAMGWTPPGASKREGEPAAPWRSFEASIDAKALATAQEISLMWGHDRSQFVSRIQIAVTDAIKWGMGATPQPSIPAPAQQDGKASGGEAWNLRLADALDHFWNPAVGAVRDASYHGPASGADVVGAIAQGLAAVAAELRAHPPRADQETQG